VLQSKQDLLHRLVDAEAGSIASLGFSGIS
jgi:hypothetical protein